MCYSNLLLYNDQDGLNVPFSVTKFRQVSSSGDLDASLKIISFSNIAIAILSLSLQMRSLTT